MAGSVQKAIFLSKIPTAQEWEGDEKRELVLIQEPQCQ